MADNLTKTALLQPIPQAKSPWLRTQLSQDNGPCRTDSLAFKDGLGVGYLCYQPAQDLFEASDIERRQPSLTMTIALEGHSNTLGTDGQRFDFIAGYSTMTAFSHVRGERYFPAGQRIRQLRLTADQSLLEQYQLAYLLSGIKPEGSVCHLFFGQHNQRIQNQANRLVELHDGTGHPLDVHIAALTLFSEQISPLMKPVTGRQTLLCADQDKLLQAREILRSQYQRPLTIAYLCATVGTNQLKLKRGFHQMFGTTPFQMLTDIRMAKACELLASGLRVSSVAYRVGYQHLSSFSAAFERYYGRSPSAFSKRIRAS